MTLSSSVSLSLLSPSPSTNLARRTDPGSKESFLGDWFHLLRTGTRIIMTSYSWSKTSEDLFKSNEFRDFVKRYVLVSYGQ